MFLISLLRSQLIFLLLVFSSSHAHGRLYREIISANGAKEITAQDNSFSKSLGPKEAVNDAFEELSERGDMDKDKRKTAKVTFNFAQMKENFCDNPLRNAKFCKSGGRCYCEGGVNKCNKCICKVEVHY